MIENKIEQEEWKAIEDFPKYAVSNMGRVRKNENGKILKASLNKKGYPHINLYREDKKRSTKKIHKLVDKYFLGPCPIGYQNNHKDGNKTNNNVSNLEYLTQSENIKHGYRLGLYTPQNGEKNPMSKLTENQVLELKSLHSKGIGSRKLSKKFNISRKQVQNICSGKRWAYLFKDFPLTQITMFPEDEVRLKHFSECP